MAKDDRFPVKEVALHSVFVADHPRVPTPVGEVSLTRQEFADECDINTIMARYEKTGGQMPVPGREPQYLDLTGLPDFQAAMQMMIDADNAFMSLPAGIRRDFDNDPAKFVEFAEDRKNLDQLREWGLAPPEKPKDKPLEVRVVPEPAAPGSTDKPAPAGGKPDKPLPM